MRLLLNVRVLGYLDRKRSPKAKRGSAKKQELQEKEQDLQKIRHEINTVINKFLQIYRRVLRMSAAEIITLGVSLSLFVFARQY